MEQNQERPSFDLLRGCPGNIFRAAACHTDLGSCARQSRAGVIERFLEGRKPTVAEELLGFCLADNAYKTFCYRAVQSQESTASKLGTELPVQT